MNDFQTALFVDTACVTNDVAAVKLSVYVNGKHYEASGSSKKDPADKSDKPLGYKLAVARAFRSIASQLERETNGLVKHHDDIKEIKQKQAKRVVKTAKRAKKATKTANKSS